MSHGMTAAELARYREGVGQYAKPSVTVDLCVFTVLDADLKVLLIRRGESPYEGRWALPGGFVRVGNALDDQGESLLEAAERELHEETSLPDGASYLEQFHTFGAPGRDPRLRVISVGYFALVRPSMAPFATAGSDAAEVQWCSLTELPELAFDHRHILEVAHRTLIERLDRTSIAFRMVPETFTIAELRAVHEAVLGERQDPGNFRRRFLRMEQDGLLEKAPGKRLTSTKPAAVYRFLR